MCLHQKRNRIAACHINRPVMLQVTEPVDRLAARLPLAELFVNIVAVNGGGQATARDIATLGDFRDGMIVNHHRGTVIVGNRYCVATGKADRIAGIGQQCERDRLIALVQGVVYRRDVNCG